MRDNKNDTTITIRLPSEFKATMADIARRERRELSDMTRLLIEEAITARRAGLTRVTEQPRHTDRPEFPHGEFDNGQHWQGQD